jgi:uncharacterized LabA/DUF88 family protein
MIRIIAYIDGFNLYHAIDNLDDNRLKWFDIKSALTEFIDPTLHEFCEIKYFTALSNHLAKPIQDRQNSYLVGLASTCIKVITGKFRKRKRFCRAECKQEFIYHEEKETDVQIAVNIVDDAHMDKFDMAFIVSQDSDLFPAIRTVKKRYPDKIIRIITPPHLKHSNEMSRIVGGQKNLKSFKKHHLEFHQLPDEINHNGKTVKRPKKYRKK